MSITDSNETWEQMETLWERNRIINECRKLQDMFGIKNLPEEEDEILSDEREHGTYWGKP